MIDRTEDRKIGHRILNNARRAITRAAGDDPDRLFYLRRFVFSRLQLDERGGKTGIKDRLYERDPRCHRCKNKFEAKRGVHLHRINEDRGYTDENCVLMHAKCHREHHRQ